MTVVLPHRGNDRAIFRALALITTLLITGCALSSPDLERLYSASAERAGPPVIVVPGLLGSRLRDRATGQELWPGSAWQALLGDRSPLALTIDAATLEPVNDDVEAFALFDGLLGQDYYGQLQRTLEQVGHYQLTRPGTMVTEPGRHYYVLPYDWRHDNVRTARKLDALIEQIRRDHDDPNLRVDVVAHSMGGLVLRYYLRYGTEDVLDDNQLQVNLDGLAKVRTAVLLGTPNLGSVSALHGFIEGSRVGWNRVPPEVMLTMPSMYQLFPHPLNDWLVTDDGRPLQRDLYAARIWRAFRWSVFDPTIRARIGGDTPDAEDRLKVMERYFEKRLERARRFVWALTRDFKDAPEQLVVLGGTCTPTPARLVVEEVKGESVVRLWPRAVKRRHDRHRLSLLMLEPGDGVVTKASLLGRQQLDPSVPRHRFTDFPLAWSLLLCETHSRLTGNPSFQDNLLDLLLNHERRYDQPLMNSVERKRLE